MCFNVLKTFEVFWTLLESFERVRSQKLRDKQRNKYTSASRKRVTHTKQMKLRDKGSIVSTTHYVFKCLQTCQRKAFNSNVLVWFRSLSRSFICSVCVTLLREALVYFWRVLNAFGRFWRRTLAEFLCQKKAINSNVLVWFLLLITELHLLRVCNPLARSAGVFLRRFKEIWNIHQRLGLHTIEQGCSVTWKWL